MKIKWLVTDVTAVGSPDIVERAFLWGDVGLALFWPIQAIFVVGEAVCNVGTPSRALTGLLRVIYSK